MKDLRDYRIPFVGLSLGTHSFIYSVDEKFFKHFDQSPVSKGKVRVDLTFEKRETLFDLRFDVKGWVETECDRCLDLFELPIEGHYQLIVKYEDDPSKRNDDDEDVMYISRADTHLDISQLVYEYIILSIPFQKIHPDDADGKSGCDPKILAILQQKEKKKKSAEEPTDPRWAALQQLKDK